MKNNLSKIGLVFLSWKSNKTLKNSLLKFTQELPSSLFNDALIYFQEISSSDSGLAKEFGFRAEGNDQNLGILHGMKQAVSRVKSEFILYLECDCVLVEDKESAIKILSDSLEEIRQDNINVMRLRHLKKGGTDYTPYKHLRYWPDVDKRSDFKKLLNRCFRPFKAQRLIGEACLVHEYANQKFPSKIELLPSSHYKISSRNLNWTNQSIMFRKDWFLSTIIPFAELQKSTRFVNGFPDLEKELNCHWWRKQNYKIGWANPGLFTHQRLDRPAEDEKISRNKLLEPIHNRKSELFQK